jgi:hypothetical protein
MEESTVLGKACVHNAEFAKKTNRLPRIAPVCTVRSSSLGDTFISYFKTES